MSLRDSFTADDFALWLSFDRHSRLSQLHSAPAAAMSRRTSARRSSATLLNNSNHNAPIALSRITAVETAPTPIIGLSNISTIETRPSDRKSLEMRRKASRVSETSNIEPLRRLPRAVMADDKSLRNADTSTSDVLPADLTALPPPSTATESEEPIKKLSATAIALIMTPLCLSVFLSALDLTIITPAIPTIVRGFHSTTGYVWIGSAFILASTASTPVWGSLGDIWGRKPILLIALTIFLGGSLLCALAPSMHSLIAGRALQGLGSAGMGTMVNIIICDTFSLRDRGLYLAITSVVWAIGSAIGPVIGGSFTTKL
tara:strand:+ start:29626 stop:30573 length:948 start_codon:yes stop_codon:yes gene_type:complete